MIYLQYFWSSTSELNIAKRFYVIFSTLCTEFIETQFKFKFRFVSEGKLIHKNNKIKWKSLFLEASGINEMYKIINYCICFFFIAHNCHLILIIMMFLGNCKELHFSVCGTVTFNVICFCSLFTNPLCVIKCLQRAWFLSCLLLFYFFY